MQWNVDSYDSRQPIPCADQIKTNVFTQMAREHVAPSATILFHDSPKHQSTIDALPEIITKLLQDGYEFRTFE